MRSFIIIEVEHGDTTDPLDAALADAVYMMGSSRHVDSGLFHIDHTVAVDLPPHITSTNVNALLSRSS